MIYLFNSASRPLYANNICNTLFLPKGLNNEFRYGKKNVSEGDIGKFIQNRFSFCKKEVLIIFVDRNASNMYKFYPIRKGKLIKCNYIGDQLYFNIKMEDFCYPKDIAEFNTMLCKIPYIPKLNIGEPNNDGYYAIEDNKFDITKKCPMILDQDSAWDEITNAISQTKAFEANGNQKVIFTRLLMDKNYLISKKQQCLKVSRGGIHDLSIYYKYPSHCNKEEMDLDVKTSNTLLVSQNHYLINGRADVIHLRISVKKYSNEFLDSLNLEFSIKDKPTKSIISSCRSIDITTVNSRIFYILLIVAALLYVFSEVITKDALFLSSIENSTIIYFISLVTKIISFYILLNLLGKKLL